MFEEEFLGKKPYTQNSVSNGGNCGDSIDFSASYKIKTLMLDKPQENGKVNLQSLSKIVNALVHQVESLADKINEDRAMYSKIEKKLSILDQRFDAMQDYLKKKKVSEIKRDEDSISINTLKKERDQMLKRKLNNSNCPKIIQCIELEENYEKIKSPQYFPNEFLNQDHSSRKKSELLNKRPCLKGTLKLFESSPPKKKYNLYFRISSYVIKSSVQWKVRITKKTSWIGIGLCSKVDSSTLGEDYFEYLFNNCCYLLSSKKRIINCNNPTENNQFNPTFPEFNEDDEFTLLYDSKTRTLNIKKEKFSLKLTKVDPIEGSYLYPCFVSGSCDNRFEFDEFESILQEKAIKKDLFLDEEENYKEETKSFKKSDDESDN